MGIIVITLLILVVAFAALFFWSLTAHPDPDEIINNIKKFIESKLTSKSSLGNFLISKIDSFCSTSKGFTRNLNQESVSVPDMSVLNSRVQISDQDDDTAIYFNVQICGLIEAPDDTHNLKVKISILDITEGTSDSNYVHARVKQYQECNSPVFCYKGNLGKLPNRTTTLSNWTVVARLQHDWLLLARRGQRKLQFEISIYSDETALEAAFTKCVFEYENRTWGYLDLQENAERTKTLGVALAFSVSAADRKMYDCEIELIKKWANENIDSSKFTEKDHHKLDKAMEEIIAFFRDGNHLNSYEICREAVEIAPVSQRYDILELCLKVAGENGKVVAEELEILKKLSIWLQVDQEKFRELVQKNLPVEICQVKDIEAILGVTSDMSEDTAREHLNREYAKWNSRVTNSDPRIKSQADQMLKLIAEARSQLVQS